MSAAAVENFASSFSSKVQDALKQTLVQPPASVLPSPSLALQDLRLVKQVADIIAPIFASRQWILQEAEARKVSPPSRRKYTRATGGSLAFCLLHISREILDPENPSEEYTIALGDAVSSIPFAFASGEKFLLFSPGMDALPLALEGAVLNYWGKLAGFKGRFIPWRHIKDVDEMSPADRLDTLADMFGLANPPSAAERGPAVLCSDADLAKAREILQRSDEFQSLQGRKTMLDFAGVLPLTQDLNLEGAANAVAGPLLLCLRKHGPMAGEAGQTALGKFFQYLIKFSGLNDEDKAALSDMVERYQLAPPAA